MVCVPSMQSMLKLGGSGGMLPRKFLKIYTKRLEFSGISVNKNNNFVR